LTHLFEILLNASPVKLVLIFLIVLMLFSGWLVWKFYPMKRKLKDSDPDSPAMLTRAWLEKNERRAEDVHSVRERLNILDLRDAPKWNEAAKKTNEQELRLVTLEEQMEHVKPRLEGVSKRVHDWTPRIGEIEQLRDRFRSLEDRHEEHVVESQKQISDLNAVKVEVARIGEKINGINERTQRVDRMVEAIHNRLLGPTTPEPRRREDG